MKSSKGFTLIELLAVIVVLAIIMVIATQQVNKTISRSRADSFKSSLDMVVKQAETFYTSEGRNPEQEELTQLVKYSKDDYDITYNNQDNKICVAANLKGTFGNVKQESFSKITFEKDSETGKLKDVSKDGKYYFEEGTKSKGPKLCVKFVDGALTKIEGGSGGGTISDPKFIYEGTKLVRLTEAGFEYYKKAENSVIEIPEGTTEIGDAAFLMPTNYDITQLPDFDYIYEMQEKYPDGNYPPEETNKITLEQQKFVSLYMAAKDQIVVNKTLNLPSSLIKIGDMSFTSNVISGNQGLIGTLKLPEGLKEIGMGAFQFNKFTGDLVIPNSVIKIGSSSFTGGFTGNLVLPDSVEEIGSSAFEECGFVGTLKLPKNLKIIKAGTFAACEFTGELIIPDSVLEIWGTAFLANKFTGTLTLSKNLKVIGNKAFFNTDFTGELYVPDSVTEVGPEAFSGSNFSSVSISSNTKYVTGNLSSFPSKAQINKR